MTIKQIKQAVESGRAVFWKTKECEVIKDSVGQWLVVWKRGHIAENSIGLTCANDSVLNGSESDFFIREQNGDRNYKPGRIGVARPMLVEAHP